MGQTAAEKIAGLHMTEGPDRALRAGDVVSLRPRHILTHDNTAPVLRKFESMGGRRVRDRTQPVFALDHDIQNRSKSNLEKYSRIESFAREQGIDFYPAGTGIGHQIMVSMGYVVPGALVVASDSHANMYGALGALGTPVVRTDAAAIWATGEFWWQIPRTVQVILDGRLAPGVTGKDVIVTLCGLYNSGEVLNSVVEFAGPGVSTLSMDERMAIANMTTEWGALAGWFPVDAVTTDYLRSRREAVGAARCPFSEEDLNRWESGPLEPDASARYSGTVEVNLEDVSPHVSGPDSVQRMRPVADIHGDRVPVQKAYIVSCVNSRFGDLEAAAREIRGKVVAPGVELYVSAASAEIQREAEESGIWAELIAAGARPLPSGCGPCIGLGEGLLKPGEVGISATNRNFKGRMGSRDAQAYLASPAVVAASAVAGFITGPELSLRGTPEYRFEKTVIAPPDGDESTEILPGFPARIEGRAVLLAQDNLNTDGIYGKDYTYRDDMTEADMARVVMQNYDPEFRGKTRPGDVLVAGYNFGTGSSREQAATALQAAGFPAVVAASFSQTYLRNAFNNGLVCLECAALVDDLRRELAGEIERGERTVVIEGGIAIDFERATIGYGEAHYRFAALGSVPQSLVAAGGIEQVIRRKLGLGASSRDRDAQPDRPADERGKGS